MLACMKFATGITTMKAIVLVLATCLSSQVEPLDEGVLPNGADAWTSTEAVVQYEKNVYLFALRLAQKELAGHSEADRKAAAASQVKEWRDEGERRRTLVPLPSMMPVTVRATARFSPYTGSTWTLVEVTDGPRKGRLFWVTDNTIRVDRKGTDFWGGASAGSANESPPLAPGAVKVPSPSPVRRAPEILVESTSWEQSLTGNFVTVHVRLQNVGGRILNNMSAKVVYEDSFGRLVSSGLIYIGNLQPGEVKTVNSFDPYNPSMNHYDFEFEGQDSTGKMGALGFTTSAHGMGGGRRR
jgi:hypothetical protein